MRLLYSIGIVLSFFLIGLSIFYSELVSQAKLEYMFSDFTFANVSYSRLTIEGLQFTMPLLLFYFVLNLFGLFKVKTKTSKVTSILGVVISFVFIVWAILVYSSPSAISFDEVALAWILFGLVELSFSIVGLVQSSRYRRLVLSGKLSPKRLESIDLLDS